MREGLLEDAIPDLPPDIQGIYAVYPPGRFIQPKVRAFIDFLVDNFKDVGPSDW
jgi:DNA-binding transcriptional LysR family regulator